MNAEVRLGRYVVTGVVPCGTYPLSTLLCRRSPRLRFSCQAGLQNSSMKRITTQVMSFVTLLMVLALTELHAQATKTLDPTAQMLAELTNAFGPPRQEEEVAQVFMKHIKPYVDDIRRDGMGNVIATKRGGGRRPARDADRAPR